MLLRFTSLVVLPVLSCLHAETLGVYLDRPLAGPSQTAFRNELQHLLKDTGVRIELRSLKERKAGESFDRLIVVQLRGACEAAESPASQKTSGPLASTQVEGGRILPYAELFCDRLRQTLAATFEREPLYRRHLIGGRAMARVLAHEIYHYLAQDKGHATNGVAKNCLNTRELTSEDFAFDHPSLARLRVAPESTADTTDAEEAAGR
jgi:hypothetical protein